MRPSAIFADLLQISLEIRRSRVKQPALALPEVIERNSGQDAQQSVDETSGRS